MTEFKQALAWHLIKSGFTFNPEVEPVIMRDGIQLDNLIESISEYMGRNQGDAPQIV